MRVQTDVILTTHPPTRTHTHTPRASDDDGDDAAAFPPTSSSATAPPPPLPPVADKTVYVEGIAYQATEEDVTRFFQDKGCGKVLAVRMPRWQDSGRPRGYAHVDFKKPEGVGKALALDGVTMMGRYLTVKRAHEPKQAAGAAAAAAWQAKPPGVCVCGYVCVLEAGWGV